MRIIKTITILFISLIIFNSCNFVLKKYYKIKDPKIETIKSSKDFLSKKILTNRFNLLFFKDFKNLKNFSKNFNLDIPEAYLFNSNGYYVPYKKSAQECNAKVEDFIKDLKFINQKEHTDLNLDSLSNYFVNDSIKRPIFNTTNNLSVILSFATYLGKVNDEHTFAWFNAISNIKDSVKVKVYFLDADIMNFWKKSDSIKLQID